MLNHKCNTTWNTDNPLCLQNGCMCHMTGDNYHHVFCLSAIAFWLHSHTRSGVLSDGLHHFPVQFTLPLTCTTSQSTLLCGVLHDCPTPSPVPVWSCSPHLQQTTPNSNQHYWGISECQCSWLLNIYIYLNPWFTLAGNLANFFHIFFVVCIPWLQVYS